MPGTARLSDICTGHGCWPPRPNDQASLDTYANGRGIHRQTDHWVTHCCPAIPECHDSRLASGSPDTYVNNLQSGRCGDPIMCGSFVATCSGDVINN
jgi:uncharacterized Zn-binding protein involved in type VI secretion